MGSKFYGTHCIAVYYIHLESRRLEATAKNIKLKRISLDISYNFLQNLIPLNAIRPEGIYPSSKTFPNTAFLQKQSALKLYYN